MHTACCHLSHATTFLTPRKKRRNTVKIGLQNMATAYAAARWLPLFGRSYWYATFTELISRRVQSASTRHVIYSSIVLILSSNRWQKSKTKGCDFKLTIRPRGGTYINLKELQDNGHEASLSMFKHAIHRRRDPFTQQINADMLPRDILTRHSHETFSRVCDTTPSTTSHLKTSTTRSATGPNGS
jgi:hypothetical protein